MTVEYSREQKGTPPYLARALEEARKANEQIRAAKETGNFPAFMGSQLTLLDEITPGLGGEIKKAMDQQKTPELMEDMFVTLWRYAVVSRVIRQEFGQPKQPATTG